MAPAEEPLRMQIVHGHLDGLAQDGQGGEVGLQRFALQAQPVVDGCHVVAGVGELAVPFAVVRVVADARDESAAEHVDDHRFLHFVGAGADARGGVVEVQI